MSYTQIPVYEDMIKSVKETQKTQVIQLRRVKKQLKRFKQMQQESKIHVKQTDELVKLFSDVEPILEHYVKATGDYIQQMRLEKSTIIQSYYAEIEGMTGIEKTRYLINHAGESFRSEVMGSIEPNINTSLVVLDDRAILTQGWSKVELVVSSKQEFDDIDNDLSTLVPDEEQENLSKSIDAFLYKKFTSWLNARKESFHLQDGKFFLKFSYNMRDVNEILYFKITIN